jgi:hypothetical protein
MRGLPRNERRREVTDTTHTPPPVTVACDPTTQTAQRGAWTPGRSHPGPRAGVGFGAGTPVLARIAGWLLLLGFASAMVAIVVSRSLAGMPPIAVATWRTFLSYGPALTEARLAAPRPEDLFAVPEAPPVKVRHDGYASIRGGVLFTPSSFAPAGSAYDLLLHFHGNTQVVRESAEVAGLNAAVAVVNLGIGSGPYQDAYAAPGIYEALLEEIDRALAQRGVPSPRLRRVALSSWSAGYGAIGRILDLRRGSDPLDAILVLDGIHTSWVGGEREVDASGRINLFADPGALNPIPLAPFARAAKLAAAGALLFSITHSEIDPIAYPGTDLTAGYLIETAAGGPVARTPERETPPHLNLRSAEGAVAKRLEKRMIPTGEARIRGLHVRGFRGNTPEHHMAHLLQMGATVLPELVARWQLDPAR